MHGQNHIVPLIWLVVAGIGVALNALLVPAWQADGAAIAQCVSFFAAAILTWALSYRITRFQPHWHRLVSSLLLLSAVIAFSNTTVNELTLAYRLPTKVLMFLLSGLATFMWVTRWSQLQMAQRIRLVLSGVTGS